MFKWIKRGVPCISEDRYSLFIGGLYRGAVNFDGEVWHADIYICDQHVTGQSGGGLTRDKCMEFVENTIKDYIAELDLTLNSTHRGIYDPCYERDENGELKRKQLE